MTVAVLVVNWNGGDLLRRCLESLERQRRRPDHIVVVDNGSSDDSLRLAEHALRDVQLIRLSDQRRICAREQHRRPGGRSVRSAGAAQSGCVRRAGMARGAGDAAEREPSGGGVRESDAAGRPRPTISTAPATAITSPAAPGATATARARASWPAADVEVFAPCAAAALYRRAAFDEVGGFDEQYFCYFEDVDLGFRLRLRGHRCVYVHAAVVRHVSSAMSGYRSDFAVYHGERNAVWTFFKDMPGPLLWLYLPQHVALNIAVAPVLSVARAGQGRAQGEARCAARPLVDTQTAKRSSSDAPGERLDAATRPAARRGGPVHGPLLHAMNPRLAVVIVNFNAGGALAATLASLPSGLEGLDWEAVVVDNQSSDGSERAAETSGAQITLLRQTANVGFAKGVNAGVAATSAPFVLVLNPDCRLERGAASQLLQEIERHPRCAVIGPRILDPNGALQESARGDPTLLTGIFGRTSFLSAMLPSSSCRTAEPGGGRAADGTEQPCGRLGFRGVHVGAPAGARGGGRVRRRLLSVLGRRGCVPPDPRRRLGHSVPARCDGCSRGRAVEQNRPSGRRSRIPSQRIPLLRHARHPAALASGAARGLADLDAAIDVQVASVIECPPC